MNSLEKMNSFSDILTKPHLLNELNKKTPEVSFVIPAYNEEANIGIVVSQIKMLIEHLGRSYEILFVDDGSTDQTVEEIKLASEIAPIHLVRLSRNFGKENAITAGLAKAKGEAVIIMDADLQHPISLIPDFLKYWDAGYEMVYGMRECRRDESWIKRKFAAYFYKLLGKTSSIHIPPNALDYRLLDRKVVNAILDLPEKNRFMKGLYNWVGFKTKPIIVKIDQRQHGSTTFNFRALFRLAITGITSFSSAPLRVWTGIGFTISLCSILYAIWVVLRTVILGTEVAGWATLTVSIMFLGGIQLISVGILGEYIGRIFDEVKARPNFIIAEEFESKNSEDA